MEQTTITYRGRKLFTLGHFGTFLFQVLIFLFGCAWLGIGITSAVEDWGIAISIIGCVFGVGIIAIAVYAMYNNRKEIIDDERYKKEINKVYSILSIKKMQYQSLGKDRHGLIQNSSKDYIVDNYAWGVLNEILLYSDYFQNRQVDLIEIIYDGLGLGRNVFTEDNYDIIEESTQITIERNEEETSPVSVGKIKLYLSLIAVLILVIYVIILWLNNWTFNGFVEVGVTTILFTLILLICVKEPSFSIGFGGLFIIGIINVYAGGYIIKYNCPHVTIVNQDRSITERYYLPFNDRLGNNHILIYGNHEYLLNKTGRTLYLTTIAYGKNIQVRDNVSLINNEDACSMADIESIRWFKEPRETIRVPKGTEGKNVTYIDFQSY